MLLLNRIIGCLLACSCLLPTYAAGPQQHSVARNRQNWHPGRPVRGVAIHFCSCSAPCACMFAGKDMKDCNLAGVYHFEDGGYLSPNRAASVRGLTLVVLHRPSSLADGAARGNLSVHGAPVGTVVYLPTGIGPAQEKALKSIYLEHILGPMASPGGLLYRKAPITFVKHADGYEVQIPAILSARTRAILGEKKRQMSVDNVPFIEGTHWLLGKAIQHRYNDPQEKAWHWDYPNSNGAWTNFSWEQVYRG